MTGQTVALLIIGFCSQFAHVGGGHQVSGLHDRDWERLTYGYDGQDLCKRAIKDCFKWASKNRCLSEKPTFCFTQTKEGYPRTGKSIIQDITETIGFAPVDVLNEYRPEHDFLWRPQNKRKDYAGK